MYIRTNLLSLQNFLIIVHKNTCYTHRHRDIHTYTHPTTLNIYYYRIKIIVPKIQNSKMFCFPVLVNYPVDDSEL